MIISRIVGGLGNQLFQYAAGRALALHFGTDFYFDITPFDTYTLHHYALDRYPLRGTVMDRAWAKRLPRRLGGSIWSRLWPSSAPRFRLLREKEVPSPDQFFDVSDNTYLMGYWQSEKYFARYREELCEEFSLTSAWSAPDARVRDQMREGNSVMLHIRRGDYVSDAKSSKIHGTCSADYYQRAVQELERALGTLQLFVFSDDSAWCRENLKFPHPTTFVDHNDATKNREELRLMSQAANFVVANSSFSWWAAWLSQNPTKRVFAPRVWFQQSDYNQTDLVPASWTRI